MVSRIPVGWILVWGSCERNELEVKLEYGWVVETVAVATALVLVVVAVVCAVCVAAVAVVVLPSWVMVKVVFELVWMAFYFLVNAELQVVQLIGYDEM